MNREWLGSAIISSAVSLITFVIAWSLRLKSSSDVGAVAVVGSSSSSLSVLVRSYHMVCLLLYFGLGVTAVVLILSVVSMGMWLLLAGWFSGMVVQMMILSRRSAEMNMLSVCVCSYLLTWL